MAVNLRQTHFRFGKDDGTESGHTFWQLVDVNHTQLITADWTFLLRFTEQETGNTAAANTDAQFQYNKNGAGWVDITTTSVVVKAVAVNAFTNGQACTKRLTGTGTFETTGAGCTEDGSSGGTANDIAALGNSETEAGLQVVAAQVANNDTIQFRFTSPDWTVGYDITPTLTIQKSGTYNEEVSLTTSGVISNVNINNLNVSNILSGNSSLSNTNLIEILRTLVLTGNSLIVTDLPGEQYFEVLSLSGDSLIQENNNIETISNLTFSTVGTITPENFADLFNSIILNSNSSIQSNIIIDILRTLVLAGNGLIISVTPNVYIEALILSGESVISEEKGMAFDTSINLEVGNPKMLTFSNGRIYRRVLGKIYIKI